MYRQLKNTNEYQLGGWGNITIDTMVNIGEKSNRMMKGTRVLKIMEEFIYPCLTIIVLYLITHNRKTPIKNARSLRRHPSIRPHTRNAVRGESRRAHRPPNKHKGMPRKTRLEDVAGSNAY